MARAFTTRDSGVSIPLAITNPSHAGSLRHIVVALVATLFAGQAVFADQPLLTTHCAKCHSGEKPKGDFSLRSLGNNPDKESVDLWVTALEYVKAGEMPPAEEKQPSKADHQKLIQFLGVQIRSYHQQTGQTKLVAPRRLNNRELANSVRDVLLIEDAGTHQPTANLVGDTLKDGFDTNGDALGISQFQMEQYIEAFRKIVDATIFSTERPATDRYVVTSNDINMTSRSQNSKRSQTKRNADSVDFFDVRSRAFFANIETAPATGRYHIKIRATGIDRGVYDSAATGIYADDPIRLSVHLGDRVRTFDVPDNEVMEIVLDEWIAAGTRIELSYPTDGLRMRGNGNFKFQYGIAHDYIKENDPDLYAIVLQEVVPKSRGRSNSPSHWSHWTEYWQGPRPRLFSAEIEGPRYERWPPQRQIALLGEDPKSDNAAAILRPIAERAWRRQVRDGELDSIVHLVQSSANRLDDIDALKEGIAAILASPSFLLINPAETESVDRFATKLSYFLKSTTPDARLQAMARSGKLQTFEAVRDEIQRQFDHSEADEFMTVFPYQWLQLDRINFMAPDPIQYTFYDKKRVSEDMIAEVQTFFRNAIEHNVPVTELLCANYSFINADLATIYDIDGVPQDSKLRQHTFSDGRRGGLLGMGAFLTLTADTLSTSPIHRAVYVMENFLGIHPTPPPPNVKITEPDVRQAKTIKEILKAHQSDANCASCHKSIDPYGYAFENFDPAGAWREFYTVPNTTVADDGEAKTPGAKKRAAKNETIPIDASATFRNGTEYRDITEYRMQMLTDANRDRFVRCFITKLLTYANGTEPDNYSEVEKIVVKSAENEYRIVDTFAAVVDSPLFREE